MGQQEGAHRTRLAALSLRRATLCDRRLHSNSPELATMRRHSTAKSPVPSRRQRWRHLSELHAPPTSRSGARWSRRLRARFSGAIFWASCWLTRGCGLSIVLAEDYEALAENEVRVAANLNVH
jgi:hypothetical protein